MAENDCTSILHIGSLDWTSLGWRQGIRAWERALGEVQAPPVPGQADREGSKNLLRDAERDLAAVLRTFSTHIERIGAQFDGANARLVETLERLEIQRREINDIKRKLGIA